MEDLELLSYCASDSSLSNTPHLTLFVVSLPLVLHRLGRGCDAADAEHPAAISPSRGAHSGGKEWRYHRQYLGMIEIGQTDRTTSLIGASNSKVK